MNRFMKAAHIKETPDGSYRVQSIQEHCQNVALLAESFASVFGAESIARYTGLLHDIGKYSDAFQRRINGSSEQVDHSTAGAQVAWQSGTRAGQFAAFCIGGHHAGLPDLGTKFSDVSDGTLLGKLRRNPEPFAEYKDELSIESPSVPVWATEDVNAAYYFIKMLFSCLVDADYLDTEAFMSDGTVSRATGESIQALPGKLDSYIAPWKTPSSELNLKRSLIMESAVSHAEESKGLFSLTVPTGGGKTITSMAFALRHALMHDMHRIIYVIPYTSIIEQTQRIFENIFGEENVVAHYSGIEFSHSESEMADRRYLATENWDAPIILTTSVQFFESIYGNRTSKCRKLHNIANSVIIFDEAQMLPVPFMRPCVLAISQLVQHFGCSAVLCTATQPALNPILSEYAPKLLVKELCPDALFIDPVFSRVTYKQLGKLSDNKLVSRIEQTPQVLCIVNSRRQAQNLYWSLPKDGRFHLSTTMTPSHRKQTLDIIRKRLQAGEKCRVISTSLIEAGVDIDFPVVYRALAGLDSILQAGGRCNREGKRDREDSIVYVFESEQKTPEMIGQNCTAAQWTMSRQSNIASKEAISDYFDFLLYTLKSKGSLDQKEIEKKMKQFAFATIAREFKLITGAEYTVYIPCPESERLLKALTDVGPTRWLLRKLGQYTVNVYEKQFNSMAEEGAIEQIAENAGILRDSSRYSKEIGLSL